MYKCRRCGAIIQNGDNFCRSCGINLLNQKVLCELKEEKVNDNELINAYIGKNADKLKNGFSICSLFGGTVYFFYRKMWLLGITWILVNYLFGLYLPSAFLYLFVIFDIFIAFNFKKYYLNYVKEQIKKIKIYNNYLDNNDLKELCQKNGGTSIIALIITIIIAIAVFIINYKG